MGFLLTSRLIAHTFLPDLRAACNALLHTLGHHAANQSLDLGRSVHHPQPSPQVGLTVLEEELSHQLIYEGGRRNLHAAEIQMDDLPLLDERFHVPPDPLAEHTGSQGVPPRCQLNNLHVLPPVGQSIPRIRTAPPP